MNTADSTGLIRHLLRSSTAIDHARVDERFGSLLERGRAGYCEFLRLSAAAIQPLEQTLEGGHVQRILPDWRERTRWNSLRADLAELGIASPPCGRGPVFESEALQFGALYVLEGSRFGARVLARRLSETSNSPSFGALRYLRHGEGQPLWPTFVERLEASAEVRRSPAEAVAGAKAAFQVFIEVAA